MDVCTPLGYGLTICSSLSEYRGGNVAMVKVVIYSSLSEYGVAGAGKFYIVYSVVAVSRCR